MNRCIMIFAMIVLVFAEGRAVQPYQPVHPDPVLESWRWALRCRC